MEQRDFRFEIKEVTEEGTFTGFASIYNVRDLGDDVVQPGAFRKTVTEHPTIPVLWQHKDPIGKGRLEDTPHGLMIHGRLTLAVGQAREALALMRDGVVKGLSIGFVPVRDEIRGGVRMLKEVKLYEVSLVWAPMCEEALITDVKEQRPIAPSKSSSEQVLKTLEQMRAFVQAENVKMDIRRAFRDASSNFRVQK